MSCYFSASCIASCEPAQIHGSISKMKMEIQKKIWTARYEKMALTVAFVYMRINSMRGSRIFYQGGVQAQWPENSLDNVFMPPKELWEAYSNRTVCPSVLLRVMCISPIFFEVGIPNLVCGCILGWQNVMYHFRVTVTLTSWNGRVSRTIFRSL